jgi:hypothetical protein
MVRHGGNPAGQDGLKQCHRFKSDVGVEALHVYVRASMSRFNSRSIREHQGLTWRPEPRPMPLN